MNYYNTRLEVPDYEQMFCFMYVLLSWPRTGVNSIQKPNFSLTTSGQLPYIYVWLMMLFTGRWHTGTISVANGLATAVHVSLTHTSVPTATYEHYLFHMQTSTCHIKALKVSKGHDRCHTSSLLMAYMLTVHTKP